MAKADDSIKELQRRIRNLERLAGALVPTADGPVLLAVAGVRDPLAAIDVGRAGPPALADLAAALQLRGEPQRVTPTLLARARRDLRALAGGPWLAMVQRAPRLFRGHGPLDEAWLAARAARIDELTAALHPAAAASADDWGAALVGAVHGPAAADALADWIERSAALGARRRREARRRVEAVIRRLREPAVLGRERDALALTLDAAARAVARLARPGRAADRRLDAVLRAVIAWPAAAAGHLAEPPVPADSPEPPVLKDIDVAALAERVRARAEPLLRALGATRTAAHLDALRRVLAAYALAFAPDPAGPPPALDPEALELAERRLRGAAGLPAGLSLPRALWLLRLPIEPEIRDAVAAWVAAGFPPALLEQLVARDQIAAFARLRGDLELALAYADWLVRLVPHYQRLGVTVELEPAHFARLHATHRGGLAVLAHCLVLHHAPEERGADAQIARLRATLGLFAARPQRAEALLADLSLAPAGLGRRHFPEFAAWLGDSPVLDRFCHLCELAGEPVALSHALRRDLERIPRMTRQRDWLAARADRTAEQDARLAHLAAEIAGSELADPAWTLRRLADRCDVLQARAFARRLDDLVRDTLAEAIGVAPPALTPAWRDVVRFWLGAADRNRGLLTRLLRFAVGAPGRPIAATTPAGQAWLARAAAHMRVEPWLAPRRTVLELDGQRHTIHLEDDPLEVLRMGIPFGTCLSLTDGFNADSTVLNAIDPNKRVLYVRDARGGVVARKLLAVSADHGLLGYRLYTDRHLPGLREAVLAFCHKLADDCGLALADAGEPAAIHPGFWYDDGTVAWTNTGSQGLASLADYFARAGRPPPASLSGWAINTLHAWDAWARGDGPRARALLPRLRNGPAAGALGETVAAHLGPRELARAARLDADLAAVQLRHLARDGNIVALMQAAAAHGRFPGLLSDVGDAIEHAPSSAALARAWLTTVARTRREAPHFDDHGLEHQTVQIGRHLALLPIAELLAVCAELDATWRWMVDESSGCADCRRGGELDVLLAAEAAYARAPGPAAVVAALAGRHGPLARRVALHLAARFSLAVRPCPLEPGLGATWLTRLGQRPVPAPHALSALRGLQRADPGLAGTADMFAALVRQAGPRAAPSHLPTPADSPLAALSELLLHLEDPAGLLAPWLTPAARDVTGWQPDRWLLHVHRRALTPWRRHLAMDDEHARQWLTLLGDEHALARFGGSRNQLAQAARVARQLGLGADPPVPLDMSAEAAALVRAGEPRAVDLFLLREAVRALLAAPDLAEPGDPTVAAALDLVNLADPGARPWQDLLACMLPGDGPPAPAVVPLVARMLPLSDFRGLDRGLLARVAAEPALRVPVRERLLDDTARSYGSVHAVYSQLERAACPDPAARDELLADFIAHAGDRSAELETPMDARHRERLAACLPIWTARPPAEWLALYRGQRDLHLQSQVLDARLAVMTADDRAALRAVVLDEWTEPSAEHEADELAAYQWLLAALTPA